MFPEFAATYRDSDNKVRLYIFPGADASGNQLYKNVDLSSIKAKYTYSKKSDNAIELIFEENIKSLHCKMINIKDLSERKFIFKNL
jgi:hypothetical protein